MNEQEMREEFEREYCGVGVEFVRRDSTTGAYVLPSISDAWAGWQAASLRMSERVKELEEALRSFVYEFGDKTNSTTVNKARAALKGTK